MTASLDLKAIAEKIKQVLDNNLTGVTVYALSPGTGAAEFPAIGIIPRQGESGFFIDYQRTFGASGLSVTYWDLEVVVDNPEPEDQWTEMFGLLGEGTERSIFDALATFNDNSEGYRGSILNATVPTPGNDEGVSVLTARIPISIHKQRTG